jgi:hypothetical protein
MWTGEGAVGTEDTGGEAGGRHKRSRAGCGRRGSGDMRQGSGKEREPQM